ncbi:putative methyltransferase BCDIN3D, partial [Stegodyphus mimosarum]
MAKSENSQNSEKFEPGAARFGNFINYYSFNSVSKRLEAIPSDLLSQLQLNIHPVVCLDIGCNSGDLTVGLYSHLTSNIDGTKMHVLGIDLDDVLITRCNESNQYPEFVTYQQIDIMDANSTAQLTAFLEKYNRTEFDLITCFSTTMWIHLNYGDSGLNNFLKTVSNITKFLLLEPQEWKCYKAAVRRMTRLNREAFAIKKLQVKEITGHITKFLQSECNMKFHACFGETSWGRSLYLFQKN